jgi:hypothetical protein
LFIRVILISAVSVNVDTRKLKPTFSIRRRTDVGVTVKGEATHGRRNHSPKQHHDAQHAPISREEDKSGAPTNKESIQAMLDDTVNSPATRAPTNKQGTAADDETASDAQASSRPSGVQQANANANSSWTDAYSFSVLKKPNQTVMNYKRKSAIDPKK